MLKKIIQFIKYHNAFTIGLVLIFIFGASVFASDTVREATIGKAVVEKAGIDNTALLAADLDNFDFSMKINNVTEDEENYYVLYTYKTLDIQDDIWQPVSQQETLTVSKLALADRDLGLYVAEELGEIVDSEKAYLVEVQQKQQEKGVTLVRETTIYTGLIGLVLNPVTKELPGYTPVVKPPELAPIVYNEPLRSPETGSPSASCSPAWVCSPWNPAESSVAFGKQFTQTRICTDYNNCGTDQGKPEEEYIAIGTYQSASASGGAECTPIYYYYDGDGDGYGYIQGSFQITCVQPEGHVPNNNDCNDNDPNINPGVSEICDDGIDNDCDGIVDNPALCQTGTTTPECQTQTFYLDSDGDSYGDPLSATSTCEQPTGYVVDNTDCNDADANINPGATEICDGKDNNCDGLVDEDCDCGITACDANLHLTGSCPNPCNGVEGCGICTPACVCSEGFSDCNSDMSDGCEVATSTCAVSI